MSKYSCVIVIPIHNKNPSLYELISFKQCFKVLNKYAIKIIAPIHLSLSKYYEVVPNFETIYIDPKWQSTLIAYNKLKTSRYFYNLFKDYDFLLTYELDAFVFKDDLMYWCSQGYDYIGAPWFEGYSNPSENAKLIGVGNSGFSLRKISSVENVLKNIFYIKSKELHSGVEGRIIAYLKTPYYWLMNLTGENYTIQHEYSLFEDIFFSVTAPSYFKDFKVAPIEEAIKFSFEVNPDQLFKLNNEQLPMGCHAWWRYNLNFWKPYIESMGFIF